MASQNRTVFGLLVLAIALGAVAGLGAGRAPGQIIFYLKNTHCNTRACNSVVWGDPPTTDKGNPLPAGTTCTMSNNMKSFCVATPGIDCPVRAVIPNGCDGTYMLMGPDGVPLFFACYQAINKC